MTRGILVAVCCAWLPLTAGAETLDELLASRELENVVHPIAAEFLAAEGAAGLTEQQRAAAVTQLKRALGRQTNPMTLTMRGAAGMMNSPSMQRMRESAQQQMSAGGLLRSAVGIGSAAPQIDGEQAQREMQQAMAEPWVRGIGAARPRPRRVFTWRAYRCSPTSGRRRRVSRTSSRLGRGAPKSC
jgi:hypothetical protein